MLSTIMRAGTNYVLTTARSRRPDAPFCILTLIRTARWYRLLVRRAAPPRRHLRCPRLRPRPASSSTSTRSTTRTLSKSGPTVSIAGAPTTSRRARPSSAGSQIRRLSHVKSTQLAPRARLGRRSTVRRVRVHLRYRRPRRRRPRRRRPRRRLPRRRRLRRRHGGRRLLFHRLRRFPATARPPKRKTTRCQSPLAMASLQSILYTTIQ